MRKIRSSFNPSIAGRYKDVFDKIIETRAGVRIHRSQSDVGLKTLRAYLCDAIKWLMEFYPNDNERTKYLALRPKIRIILDEDADCVVVEYKELGLRGIETGVSAKGHDFSWKDKLISWLENPRSDEMIVIKGIHLTKDEIADAQLTLAIPGIESKVDSGTIKAIKTKDQNGQD